jgi:hypothetical protein
VTGVGAELWSFFPPTLKFTLVGTLNCLSSPDYMTVDRQGSAWVLAAGQLYKASTVDASCAAVPTWPPQPAGYLAGLTFVGTSNAIDNTLYLMSSTNLARFDVPSGMMTTVGPAPVANAFGDMTSNGDGTLYFLNQAQVTLYDVSPTTGAVLSTAALNAQVQAGGSQALAFWGGSFYAFEQDVIYQYDPVMKTTTSLGNAPLMVTGAGQSTCVPKTPPPLQ